MIDKFLTKCLDGRCSCCGKKERGAILFVSMMLLIILTIMGISALRVSAMEERMAGNTRDRAIAFQAAEAALRAAEIKLTKVDEGSEVIADGAYTGTACTKGIFRTTAGVPYFASVSGQSWDGNSQAFWNSWPWSSANCYFSDYVTSTDIAKIGYSIETPRYVIEEMPQASEGSAYRITAMGYGFSKKAQVILQATFASN